MWTQTGGWPGKHEFTELGVEQKVSCIKTIIFLSFLVEKVFGMGNKSEELAEQLSSAMQKCEEKDEKVSQQCLPHFVII